MSPVHKQWIVVAAVVALGTAGLILVNRQPTRDQSTVTGDDPVVEIDTMYGPIRIRLLRQKAPETVANFVSLVRKKFYDGLSFTTVNKPGGVIGGGQAPKGKEIKEFVRLEENDLRMDRGTVAMWHPQGQGDNNTSAFMILLAARPGMEDFYTAFGRVESGMDVVDTIANVETTGPDGKPPFTPLDRVTIRKITILDEKED